MRFYWAYFKLKFITGLQYRASAIAGLSTQFFFGLINILVYIAFYESSKTTATPINLNALATYIWLNQAFYALIFMQYKDAEIVKMIKEETDITIDKVLYNSSNLMKNSFSRSDN